MEQTIETVLFDLDGTLLDTHRDLAAALNVVLENHGKPALPSDILRPLVSKGALVMICHAFQCTRESKLAQRYRVEMLDAYEANIARHTELFPGMDTVLEKILVTGRKWGIVTNKPEYYTNLLLASLDLPWVPYSVVSGDTLSVKKPNPEPLLLAMTDIGGDPARAIYVGDDERDVLAAKNTGMHSAAVTYGYHLEGDHPSSWNADVIIDHPHELLEWIP